MIHFIRTILLFFSSTIFFSYSALQRQFIQNDFLHNGFFYAVFSLHIYLRSTIPRIYVVQIQALKLKSHTKSIPTDHVLMVFISYEYVFYVDLDIVF